MNAETLKLLVDIEMDTWIVNSAETENNLSSFIFTRDVTKQRLKIYVRTCMKLVKHVSINFQRNSIINRQSADANKSKIEDQLPFKHVFGFYIAFR